VRTELLKSPQVIQIFNKNSINQIKSNNSNTILIKEMLSLKYFVLLKIINLKFLKTMIYKIIYNLNKMLKSYSG